jgi:hypothetical protein
LCGALLTPTTRAAGRATKGFSLIGEASEASEASEEKSFVHIRVPWRTRSDSGMQY